MAKQNSGTADEMHKAREGIEQNKKYNNHPVREQATISTHMYPRGGEKGGEGGEGGGGNKNAKERSATRSPVSFSSEKETGEPRPLPLLYLGYCLFWMKP